MELHLPDETKERLSAWLRNYLHREVRKQKRGAGDLCAELQIYAKTDDNLYVLDHKKKEHLIGKVMLPMTQEEFQARNTARASISTGHKIWMHGRYKNATIDGQAVIAGESNG